MTSPWLTAMRKRKCFCFPRTRGAGCCWMGTSGKCRPGCAAWLRRACCSGVGLVQELCFDMKGPDTADALPEGPPQASVQVRLLGQVFPLLLHERAGKGQRRAGGGPWGCVWRGAVFLTLCGTTLGKAGGSASLSCSCKSWLVQQGGH